VESWYSTIRESAQAFRLPQCKLNIVVQSAVTSEVLLRLLISVTKQNKARCGRG
jgi:hypothetical protein